MRFLTIKEVTKISDAARIIRNESIIKLAYGRIKMTADMGEYSSYIPSNSVNSNLDKMYIVKYFRKLGYKVDIYEDGSVIISWQKKKRFFRK